MKTEYVSALISGVFTLIATLFGFFLKYQLKTKIYKASGRKRNLTGNWQGQTTLTNGHIATLTSGTIKSSSKSITGSTIVEYENQRFKIKFQGFYLDDDYISISYISDDENIKNFGSQILKINGNCTKLIGVTVGYGNVQEGIIEGRTVLNKIV